MVAEAFLFFLQIRKALRPLSTSTLSLHLIHPLSTSTSDLHLIRIPQEEVLPRQQDRAVRGRGRPEARDAVVREHRRADGDELVRGVLQLRPRPPPHVRPERGDDMLAQGKKEEGRRKKYGC